MIMTTSMNDKKPLIQRLFSSAQSAQKRILEMSPSEKKALEKTWDVEHAYYSSALEGSKLDKKEFERLAENVQ